MKYAYCFAACCALIGYAALEALDTIFGDSRDKMPLVVNINDYRKEKGVKPLRYDTRLACAAQLQAYDMEERRSCVSTGKRGELERHRADDCGYPYMEGEFIVLCGGEGYNPFNDLITNYGEKLTKYKNIGHGEFQGFNVIFLAN